jgi:hypothetical protein
MPLAMAALLMTFVLAMPAWADPAPTGIRAHWSFEEGTFDDGFGPSSRTVLDSSGNGNHGYRHSTQSRVQYTPAAYLGSYALEFNSPTDGGTEAGIILFPHDISLEPATGMIESWLNIDSLPSDPVLLFSKSTFQFLRSEPGAGPPIFYPPVAPCPAGLDCSDGRIIGRSVYRIDVLPDGRVKATIANDGLAPTPGNLGGPWTTAVSSEPLTAGDWHHVAIAWDGCRLEVMLDGVWSSGVDFDPIPAIGLSYHGTGIDPTFGPVDLPASMSSPEFSGRMDEVRISSIEACPEFVDAEAPELEPIQPREFRSLGALTPFFATPKDLRKAARKKIKEIPFERYVDDFSGAPGTDPAVDCGSGDCPGVRNGESDDFLKTPAPTANPFDLVEMIQFYTKGGDLLQEFWPRNFFKRVWDPKDPNSINRALNLPNNLPCDVTGGFFAETIFCIDQYYDTRVIFDSYRKRFWITALARNSKTRDADLQQSLLPHTLEEEYAARRSKLLVAVSKSDNPMLGWHMYWWDAVIDDGACTSATVEPCPDSIYMPGDAADYPSIGVSSKFVIITNTVARRDPDDFLIDNEIDSRYQLFNILEADGFANASGARLWQTLYNDPNDPSRLYQAATQPAVHHGSSPFDIHYLASNVGSAFQIWGIRSQGTGFLPAAHVVQKDYTWPMGVVQQMPQPDFTTNVPARPVLIRNLSGITLKASVRDSLLHFVMQDCMRWEPGPPEPCADIDPAGSSSIKLVRVNVHDFAFGNVPQTAISGYVERTFGLRNQFDDASTWTVYYGNPAVEVNKHGDMVAVYSRSGDQVFPEVRYSAYFHNEPDIRPSRELRAGVYPYGTMFDPTNPRHLDGDGNRTGTGNLDTGGIAVDPYDDEAIWMVHGFADDCTSGTTLEGCWRFAVGKVFGEVHPDLIVSDVGLDSKSATAGQQRVLTATVRNQGDGPSGVSRLRVVLSLDKKVSSNDHEIADLIFPGMAAGSDFGAVKTVTIPRSVPAGRYYILAHTDWQNLVVEYSDANNTSQSDDRLQVSAVGLLVPTP